MRRSIRYLPPLVVLLAGAAVAAPPPDPEACPTDEGRVALSRTLAAFKPDNVDALLGTADVKPDLEAAARVLRRRVEAMGGRPGVIEVRDGHIVLKAWLPDGDPYPVLAIGQLGIHEVDEAALQKVVGRLRETPVPGIDIGSQDTPESEDRAALEAWTRAHPVEGANWGIDTWTDGRLRSLHRALPLRPARLVEGDLDRCSIRLAEQPGGLAVQFAFNEAGTKAFAELTRATVGRRIAITVDGVVKSAPVVMEPITGGRGMFFTGPPGTSFGPEAMVAILRSGALPVLLRVESVPSGK